MPDIDYDRNEIQPAIARTMSLGHNMPPISTHYEPQKKNRQGKTFEELLPDLQARFEPEAHKNYEIGYSDVFKSKIDYVYLPVDAYEDRLNDVVGYGLWLIETVGAWIDESKRPVLRMRLRILDVVFETNGYAKPRGTWKGSLTEICAADGLKEACEKLTGMGRYLKKQDETILYIWKNSRDPKQREEMIRLAGQRRLDLPGSQALNARRGQKPEKIDLLDAMDGGLSRPAPAKTTAKPATRSPAAPRTQQSSSPANPDQVVLSGVPFEVPKLYPQHSQLIRQAREVAGASKEWVSWYLSVHCGGATPSDMPIEALNPLLEAIALKGFANRFPSDQQCASSYRTKIDLIVGGQGGSHFEAFCRWCETMKPLRPVREAAAAGGVSREQGQET